MSSERRRYFRINDTVKLSYRKLDKRGNNSDDDSLSFITEQDRRIEVLMSELQNEHPKIMELIALLNEKIDRASTLEKSHNATLAYRAREVNMSACGLAFTEDFIVSIGSQLALYLELNSGQKLTLNGLVVGCILKREEKKADDEQYVWRVDFINVSEADQELLIQNVVQRQSAQLANRIKTID